MVGMWAALVVLAIASPDTLRDIWSWVRDLPAYLEVLVWIAFLPWLIGLGVWQADLDAWLRWLIIALLAVGWSIAALPRAK
jgi:hypothetical protein